MWREKWFGRKPETFADGEVHKRAWRSANAWYRLTGRFSLFGGWTEKVLSAVYDIVCKYKGG
jgi:hypothetical protein